MRRKTHLHIIFKPKLSYSGPRKEDCYVCSLCCVIKNDNSSESIVTFYHVFAVDIIIYLFI